MKIHYTIVVAVIFLTACSRPISDFTYKVQGDYAPTKVQFENQSKKADAYTWEFGDGNISMEESPYHIYSSSGNYTVRLIASKGAKMVAKEYQVFIPAPTECLVEITTEYGTMLVKLYDDTPLHRDNFLKLVEEGYYEDLLFHRVINGFMIQGGDPDSRNAKPKQVLGMGGPDYRVPAEFRDTLIHVKGALAAARDNNAEKASSGSQFYIVHGQKISAKDVKRLNKKTGGRYSVEQRELYETLGGTPQLDGEYTVFGRVVEGLEVIDKIAKVATDKRNRPTTNVTMKMKIIE